MGGIGPEKLVLVLIIALLFFGAKRIPEIGQSLGKGIREFKHSLSSLDDPPSAPLRDDRREPPRQLNDAENSTSAAPVRDEPRRLRS